MTINQTVRLFVLCGVLGGCVDTIEQQRQTQLVQQDQECRSWGTQPGTQAYVQCRAALSAQDAQMRQALAGAVIGNMMAPR